MGDTAVSEAFHELVLLPILPGSSANVATLVHSARISSTVGALPGLLDIELFSSPGTGANGTDLAVIHACFVSEEACNSAASGLVRVMGLMSDIVAGEPQRYSGLRAWSCTGSAVLTEEESVAHCRVSLIPLRPGNLGYLLDFFQTPTASAVLRNI